MSDSDFDPRRCKEEQRQAWNSVASGWAEWWEAIERGGQVVSDRLIEAAGLQPGHRVLDLATGIGEPALTAAKRVGPSGRVLATDQASNMLELGRKRAAGMGLRNVEFLESDTEELTLPPSSFDAVLSRWGLMFLPDLSRALAKVASFLTPGGRFATAVWGPPEKVPLITIASRTVREQLGVPPPPPDVPGPFSLADVTVLERALGSAGFSQVRSERITVTFEWPSAEEYTGFQRSVAASIRALVADLPTERQETVWDAITKAVQQYAGTDGVVRLHNEGIIVTAQR